MSMLCHRDLGVMDDEGYVSIVGRIKDMVIRGGENIYPTEVENLLHRHPKIAEAQVRRRICWESPCSMKTLL